MIVLYLVLAGSLAVTVAAWRKLDRVFQLFRVQPLAERGDEGGDMPSVSLCIPARNETHAMSDCLESALRSSYPKLEIIVLDDGSRDTTGQLIRAFAHAGVRFVEGSPLPDGWLGKNHALDELAHEASADIILFADVDTRFSPHSIERIVRYLQVENAEMVSVLPTRVDPTRSSAVLATMRSFWNILGHTKRQPASASAAWMIRRPALDAAGGFAARPLTVSPDKFFARATAEHGAYRFAISSPWFGVSYEKKVSSQYETAIRLYYPLFGTKGIAWRSAGLVLALAPWFVLVLAAVYANAVLLVATAATLGVSILVHMWYLGVVRSRLHVLSIVVFPFVMCREIGLLIRSRYDYHRGAVQWKGRPVQSSKHIRH